MVTTTRPRATVRDAPANTAATSPSAPQTHPRAALRVQRGSVLKGLSTALPATEPTALPATEPTALPAPGQETGLRRPTVRSTASPSDADSIAELTDWVETFANFYPWWSGSLLPQPLQQALFHTTPVASPMQVEMDLAGGQTSGAIPFDAVSPEGTPLLYSVPAKGMPGGPDRGTVTVDNATGTFRYTPDETFTGTDTFSFIAEDSTTVHLHALAALLNAAFGILGTSLAGGHRDTATVTVFNNVDIATDLDPLTYTDIVGEFSVLTYDISGLPLPLSGGPWPRFLSAAEIGSRINAFDIVNVQQDIAYHPFLLAGAAFPDQTPPSVPTWLWPVGVPFSDGLNSLSAYNIESLDRQAWDTRPDLFNPGGFTYARQHIPGGSSIDVYNVDTSGGPLTNSEIAQLSEFIGENSVGRAVVVTGDFGQLYSDPGQALTAFAADNGLTDAWVEVEYGGTVPVDAPTCAYDDSCEQTSKIFYRDAAPLDPADPATSPVLLDALSYTNEGLNFRTDFGADLSSGQPLSVSFGYSVDAIGPMTVDPANWMAELPMLSGLPLTQIPIPGTHDSGSYSITTASDWCMNCADSEPGFDVFITLPDFIQNLLIKPIATAWARTTDESIYDQFANGIRYVDLRLTNEPDGQIYIEHGLRGAEIDVILDDIAAFANSHPKELLVVIAGGFSGIPLKGFTPETNVEFVARMEEAFGSRMAPRSLGTSATLADLWAIDKNIIVLYPDSDMIAANPNLWPDDTIWRPWTGSNSVGPLYEGNVRNLAARPESAIWGLFGEPTPDSSNIIAGLLTTGPQSNEQYFWNIHGPLQQWIRTDFKESVNLVTTDWYQRFWPAGSSFVRDTIGAVYETLGSRLIS